MMSRARPMGSSGQRRRVRRMPVGTAKSSPPNEESPPCQMASTCCRVVGVVAQIREHVQRASSDDGRQNDPQEHADEPVGAVAVSS
jgi:hypothetical protein